MPKECLKRKRKMSGSKPHREEKSRKTKIELKVSPETVESLVPLLGDIQNLSQIGASRGIMVAPGDSEYEKEHFIDGDGPHNILEIKVDGESPSKKLMEKRVLRGYVDEVLQKGKYDHINFKPPESVARAATRGLEMRKKAPPSKRGGLSSKQAAKEGVGNRYL